MNALGEEVLLVVLSVGREREVHLICASER